MEAVWCLVASAREVEGDTAVQPHTDRLSITHYTAMQASSGQQRTLEIYLVKKVAPQIKRSVSRT